MLQEISFNIPSEAFSKASAILKTARVYFISFKTGKFFRTISGPKQDGMCDLPVLIASIKNVTISNLTELVTYGFPNTEMDRGKTCVYWSLKGKSICSVTLLKISFNVMVDLQYFYMFVHFCKSYYLQ